MARSPFESYLSLRVIEVAKTTGRGLDFAPLFPFHLEDYDSAGRDVGDVERGENVRKIGDGRVMEDQGHGVGLRGDLGKNV